MVPLPCPAKVFTPHWAGLYWLSDSLSLYHGHLPPDFVLLLNFLEFTGGDWILLLKLCLFGVQVMVVTCQ